MKGIIIAGTHSGAGKTTIAVGLMALLQKRGMTVQPFKVGPDYIDPSYHRLVCGRPSYNLDTWMMGIDAVKSTFTRAMQGADIGIIEGVMGLFDGKDGRDEQGSTAHIAKILKLPVILIVDARSMARSAGALVYGYERFDPGVKIAGVIFNRVGSVRHYKMLKDAVEAKCKARALGYIPRDEEIILPERHLGLEMADEAVDGDQWTVIRKRLVKLSERFINIDEILKLSSQYRIQKLTLSLTTDHSPPTTRIAVARDNAFCFYYQENLDIFKQLGAELVSFSPLKDKRLPGNINGIYLGGGYPELYAKRLETNKPMRKAIKDFAERGMPVYAECGGLMYLGKGLKNFKGEKYEMVGVFPWISRMLEKRKSLGYREVKAVDECPFLKKGQKIRGHEYHYSEIDEPSKKIKRCFTCNPPIPPLEKGGKGGFEGYLYKNTLTSYVHLHFASNPKFAEGFVRACSLC
ncbi:MAG: cobyrinate a,c-diamide synthase, partial [Deltaproteobacteria bacterium]